MADVEAERRARKERDAARQRRHQERAQADTAKPADKVKGGLPPLGEGENRLLRDTPFLCDFHFRNDLPLPPVWPKLLPVPVDRARITAFQPVGLAWDRPTEALLEYELALAVDPLDADLYRVPPGGPPPLDPEDEALLAPEPAAAGGARAAKKAKLDNNAGWLMRTLYLSDAQLPKASNADENVHARALKERQLAAEGVFLAVPPGGDAKDAQVQSIEESFEAMQTAPVHATKPELKAVDVMPILPDFARWPEAFVTVSFDHDPLSEVPYAAKAPHLRAAAARGAFMKSFMLAPEVDDPNEAPLPPERFIVYFAPTEATASRSADDGHGPGDAGEDSTHEWVREYTYRTLSSGDAGDAAQTLVLYIGDGCASYVPLDRRFELRRRVARGGGAAEGQLPRPGRVTVATRERTADEHAQAEERLQALTHPVLERPATPVDDDDGAGAPAVAAQIARDIFGDSDDDDAA